MFMASCSAAVFAALSFTGVDSYWLGVVLVVMYVVYLIIVLWKDIQVRTNLTEYENLEDDSIFSPIVTSLSPRQIKDTGVKNQNSVMNSVSLSPHFTSRALFEDPKKLKNVGSVSSVVISEHVQEEDQENEDANSIGDAPNFVTINQQNKQLVTLSHADLPNILANRKIKFKRPTGHAIEKRSGLSTIPEIQVAFTNISMLS